MGLEEEPVVESGGEMQVVSVVGVVMTVVTEYAIDGAFDDAMCVCGWTQEVEEQICGFW